LPVKQFWCPLCCPLTTSSFYAPSDVPHSCTVLAQLWICILSFSCLTFMFLIGCAFVSAVLHRTSISSLVKIPFIFGSVSSSFFSCLTLLLLFFSPSAANIECWVGIWCHGRPDLFSVSHIFSMTVISTSQRSSPIIHRDIDGTNGDGLANVGFISYCFPFYVLK